MKPDVTQRRECPRILIIEATVGRTPLGEEIASQLNSAGFDVVRISGYSETLLELEVFKPDMVILDETVSGSLKLCYQYATTRMPVILVGEDTSQQIWNKALIEAGAEFYLRKPIRHVELVARIKAILRRYKRRGNRRWTPGGDSNRQA
jgi:DNA-binding response OmpR family regulator